MKKIILFLTIIYGLVLTMSFVWAAEATSDRALEIVYPQIPGYTTEKVVFSGLPDYIKYIFSLSVWLIGLVILGALIYSGFQYFTSFGNPEKFSAAKNGIISAFLGAIILLSAYLLFNTINPQLTILEAPPLSILEPVVMPGIYLCNYKPPNVRASIEKYLYGDKDEKIKAAKELTTIMQNGKNKCFKVARSWNLDSTFDPKLHDIFVIPRIDYVYNPENPSEPKATPVNDYGLIFHEKDNFLGKYALAVIYPLDIATYPDFTARSVTLFQKPEKEPDSSRLGVILYQCLAYNEGSFCPEGLATPDARPFKPEGDNYEKKVFPADLGPGLRANLKTETVKGYGGFQTTEELKSTPTEAGTRSIKIDPVGSYFALLFDGDHFGDNSSLCEVISENDPNLLDNKIGQCGTSCNEVVNVKNASQQQIIAKCGPCLKSMIVVKGQIIR